MIIDRIEIFHVALPLITPWRTAYGEDSVVESVLCRMTSGSTEAWGESCPLAAPCYSPEWAGGIFETAKRWLAPRVLGQDFKSGEEIQHALSIYKGNSFAKALIDNTWWTLHAKLTEQPLHRLFGAKRDCIPVGADFGVQDSIEELLDLIHQAVSEGFPRIKLKFRPGWDLPMLRSVRNEFPDTIFHIDCNSGYTLADLSMFQEIDSLDLAMIEQPLGFDDLHDHAKLQSMLKTPICLDESISSPERARKAIELKACRYINIKPGRVGGITNALKIHNDSEDADIPCWVGGMLESSVGGAICISLGMLGNFSYPADIFPSSNYYKTDLGSVPITIEKDHRGIPSVRAMHPLPTPHPERLSQCTVQSAVFR